MLQSPLPPVRFLEPYYLPPVAWWAQAQSAGEVWVCTGIRYRRQTLFNRCYIKGPNRVQLLSVPVEKGRREPPLAEVRIAYREDWVRLHRGALETAYRASPFYVHFVPDILAHLATQPATLLAVTLPLLELLADGLGLGGRLRFADVPPGQPPAILAAREPAAGQLQVPYYQPFGGFQPGLSGLDLLCNCGPQAPEVLRAMGP